MEIKPVSILWFALDNVNVFHSNSVYTYFKSDYFVFYTSFLRFYIEQQQQLLDKTRITSNSQYKNWIEMDKNWTIYQTVKHYS